MAPDDTRGALRARAAVGRRRSIPSTLLGMLILALVVPAAAQAHAFLIDSSPQQGARLAAAPPAITLTFSEAVAGGSAHVTLRRADGTVVKTGRPLQQGAVVREPLPSGLRGIFVLSWYVQSADDGHATAGEFAFAAGASGRLPAVAAGTVSRTPPEQDAFSVLLFVGLALALGGVVSERVVLGSELAEARRAPVAAGLALALVAALGQLVLFAGQRAGGGFGAGLSVGRIGSVIGGRLGVLTLVLIGSLLVAAGLARFGRRWPAAAPLLACVAAISLRSHASGSGHTWAVAIDALHLLGATVWFGALAHLVLVARSRARETPGPGFEVAVRRYSVLALPTVLVILAAGAVDALAEFKAPAELVTTGYGRTLLVKGALVALALTLALGSRLFALPGNPGVRLRPLRRFTRGELTALAAALVAAGVLVNAAPPRSTASTGGSPSAAVALGPPPIAGPTLQLGDLAGLGIAVGVTAGPDELRFRVLKVSNPAPSATRLVVDAEGPRGAEDLYPRHCGSGCFDIHYRLRPGTTRLAVKVAIPAWPSGTAHFQVSWPPGPPQATLLARVASAMRAVATMVLTERVSSGDRTHARPGTYRISGQEFMAAEPWAAGAIDVLPLDRKRPYRRLVFALPGSDIWVTVSLDDRNRLRSETIVSPGHLIRRSFSYPRG